MKGAFLLSEDPNLFEHVANLLRARGAAYSSEDGGVVQMSDEGGRLLTVFGEVPEETAWEYRSDPDEVAPGVAVPDLERVTACAVECRDETWFVAVMAALARELEQPSWVLDGDGMLWGAGQIDVNRLRL
jgi:hypothetical protein